MASMTVPLLGQDEGATASSKPVDSEFERLLQEADRIQECVTKVFIEITEFLEEYFSAAADRRVKWDSSHKSDRTEVFSVIHQAWVGEPCYWDKDGKYQETITSIPQLLVDNAGRETIARRLSAKFQELSQREDGAQALQKLKSDVSQYIVKNEFAACRDNAVQLSEKINHISDLYSKYVDNYRTAKWYLKKPDPVLKVEPIVVPLVQKGNCCIMQ
jgi:hypothetical protein